MQRSGMRLIVLRRMVHGRVRLTKSDRWFFIQLYRRFPSILSVLTIIWPEALVRWHREIFGVTGQLAQPIPDDLATTLAAFLSFLLPR